MQARRWFGLAGEANGRYWRLMASAALGIALVLVVMRSSVRGEPRGTEPSALVAQTSGPGVWLNETVDDSGDVGEFVSLALAPTAPYTAHVSYRDYTNQALKHAWRTSGGWERESVDTVSRAEYTSLALEPAYPYTPHIAYLSLIHI